MTLVCHKVFSSFEAFNDKVFFYLLRIHKSCDVYFNSNALGYLSMFQRG